MGGKSPKKNSTCTAFGGKNIKIMQFNKNILPTIKYLVDAFFSGQRRPEKNQLELHTNPARKVTVSTQLFSVVWGDPIAPELGPMLCLLILLALNQTIAAWSIQLLNHNCKQRHN